MLKEIGIEKKSKKVELVNDKLFVISIGCPKENKKRNKIMDTLEYLDSKSIAIVENANF